MKKTAFITGGTKGIGFGIAESLLKEGWKVGITGRSQQSVDEGIGNFAENHKESVTGYVCDVRDLAAQESAVQQLVKKYGSLDLLVANAGLGHFASISEMTPDQWNETIDVNLTGVFNTLKAGLEPLKKSKGFFITLASLAGTNFFPKGAAYCASKFGLVGFTQAAMLDLREFDIRTSTIMPGSVATHFNGNVPDEKDAWKIQPEDIGSMVVHLTQLDSRTLPSKIEVRPSFPSKK